MEKIHPTLGRMPAALKHHLKLKKKNPVQTQIELKYLVPRKVWEVIRIHHEPVLYEIEQVYLNKAIVLSCSGTLGLPASLESFTEFRLRVNKESMLFTAKSDSSHQGTQRQQIEMQIANALGHQLIRNQRASGQFDSVKKTRFSFSVKFAQEFVTIDVDDYQEVHGKKIELDFLTCELKVPQPEIADIFLTEKFYSRQLLFLKQCVQVTGDPHFSNRYLAEHGFPGADYNNIVAWLKKQSIQDMIQATGFLDPYDPEAMNLGLEAVSKTVRNIQRLSKPSEDTFQLGETFHIQNIFEDIAFSVKDSKGRKKAPGPMVSDLDRTGKGWIRDYHEIISCNPFIRLNNKPQIFRPGIGHHSNTTTRGAHTSDVIATSFQLARQLGLNPELCMAAGALHDLGHAPGGHIGEEALYRLSGRKFQHHIFSLSLAEIFDLNLLGEVMTCSFFHKSGGKNLKAPDGHPQEYGIVRIADKISYCPWDFFDSLANGYISKKDVDPFIYKTLGKQPMQWIWTLIQAVISESAEAHCVQFTEQSGDVFKAYTLSRALVYEKVHSSIQWATLNAQLEMIYEKVKRSFPSLDPVVIVAYITDRELNNLTTIIDSEPKDKHLDIRKLENLGFGFTEIVKILERRSSESDLIYYTLKNTVSMEI